MRLGFGRVSVVRFGVLFQSGRGVAQPGLARHLGVVEVARSNRVAPIFWPSGQKIESRGEKVEQESNTGPGSISGC